MSEFQQVVNEGAKTLGKKIKKALLIFLAGIVLIGALVLWGASWTYSDGTRAGYLIKVTYKGVMFKTYEGQLNTGGFETNADSGLVGNIWDFSVNDDAVYKKLQELEGQKVELAYKERYKSFPWQAKTENIVYDVTEVE